MNHVPVFCMDENKSVFHICSVIVDARRRLFYIATIFYFSYIMTAQMGEKTEYIRERNFSDTLALAKVASLLLH